MHSLDMARTDQSTTKRAIRIHLTIDVLLILLLSFAAQATHFSYQQGRALICADSAQYVTAAEALVNAEHSPHFEMRKPGYVLFLAAVALAFGNMGWAVVTGHYILLGMLPLAAYGWGVHLRSRWTGWLAAILTIATLQEVVWGNRVLSEPLFASLFSFGLLSFVVGLSRERPCRWMWAAGVLLGLAWLTRGAAVPAIAVAVAAILVTMHRQPRRALASCVAFAAPLVACVLMECGLNRVNAGQFRPSNGTVGATALLRARHFEGFDLPHTPDATRVFALLPERDRENAYIANHLDVWVARYHAIHDQGMDEWEYDRLMGRVGWHALTDNFHAYLTSSTKLALCHLLRCPDGQIYSPVPEERRGQPVIHPAAETDDDWDTTWFAYWGLPHLPLHDSVGLVDRMKTAAATRAPFGNSTAWKAFRYWKTKPVAKRSLASLHWLGSLWPGFAILGCAFLGLNRRTCLFLGVAYVLDALFIGLLTPTNIRLQFIWIVTDTALVAGLVVGVLSLVGRRVARLLPRFRPRTAPCSSQ